MRTVLFIVLSAAALAGAATRVVLFEDFTNCGCGPCWSIEPTLNAFVNAHLAAGNLSVARVHVWWPSASDPIYVANPTEQTARVNYYGINAVPTLKMDGVLTPSSSNLETAFNTRMAVPCYLDISVSKSISNETGVLYVTLTASQSLGSETLRLHAILVEDDVPGAGYWSGSYFEQAFRDNLCGGSGQTVSFSGGYPSTVNLTIPYGTGPWVEDNVSLCLFLQGETSKEVFNAYYRALDLIPPATGIGDRSGVIPALTPVIRIAENPACGALTVVLEMPEGPGTLSVFDLEGHLVEERSASSGTICLEPEDPGVYFIRARSGELVSTATAVVL
ncbi:hypothetical protein GX411_10020 [Candidatus Fermentibacteria bacterium]|nr:hypothetical protein [Candidatus Fermentibacteria bacterium]